MRSCQPPGTGRITAAGSSRPRWPRILQRKRRPMSNVDSMMVLQAKRGGTSPEYVTMRAGARGAFVPPHKVR
jgi:hypothetical protein